MVCENPYCHIFFATVKEMRRHLRIDHYADRSSDEEITTEGATNVVNPLFCPVSACRKAFKRKSWLMRLLKDCHKEVDIG